MKNFEEILKTSLVKGPHDRLLRYGLLFKLSKGQGKVLNDLINEFIGRECSISDTGKFVSEPGAWSHSSGIKGRREFRCSVVVEGG